MTSGPSPDATDLTVEQVRSLLRQQGFTIPEVELIEVTSSLNALVEGLSHMEQYGPLENEPWPTLVGYVADPRDASGRAATGGDDA